MLRELLEEARAGAPLWLCELRQAFARAPDGVPAVLRLRSFDGRVRDWRLTLPAFQNEEERRLIRGYLRANAYNALSVCGGYELTLFAPPEARAIAESLPEVFDAKARRHRGLARSVLVANRMARAFDGHEFTCAVRDIGQYEPAAPAEAPPRGGLAERLRRLCAAAEEKNCIGVDVGGTDIKLAASAKGRLVAVKEYDWNPAAYDTAERIIEPILTLTRLLRARIAAEGDDVLCAGLSPALKENASDAEMRQAAEAAERALGERVDVLDAVGVSFPDIVLYDRVVGGETPKTDGLRRAAGERYEEQFARLGALKERLLRLCRTGGVCRIANDGSMAAFTAAAELACGAAPERIGGGVIAHSIGTDLGTGWLNERGEIPQLPLEFYDILIDLGSFPAAALPAGDLRSIRNENSGLPGVRRYVGQAAAYRLAWELDPRLLEGFAEERGGMLRIRTEPEDLRKPCLEHLMRRADGGDRAAEEIFRRIGRHLGAVNAELEFLLRPAADRRFLFGRFVKSGRCFALLREGFSERPSGVSLENGGEGLAETSLMRQLAARSDGAVAQFAQAVGALYYSFG